jgi:hypothetical protein
VRYSLIRFGDAGVAQLHQPIEVVPRPSIALGCHKYCVRIDSIE